MAFFQGRVGFEGHFVVNTNVGFPMAMRYFLRHVSEFESDSYGVLQGFLHSCFVRLFLNSGSQDFAEKGP